jgi:hypothetical protein
MLRTNSAKNILELLQSNTKVQLTVQNIFKSTIWTISTPTSTLYYFAKKGQRAKFLGRRGRLPKWLQM